MTDRALASLVWLALAAFWLLVLLAFSATGPGPETMPRTALPFAQQEDTTMLRTLLAVAAAGVLLVACGGGGSSVPIEQRTLQTFGDSTQWLAEPLLAQRLGAGRLIRSAVRSTRSGDLADGISDERAAELEVDAGVPVPAAARPPWPRQVAGDVVIINHGINDARPWAPVSIADYKANLRKLATAAGAIVVFETPNPSTYPGRDTAPYAQAMREVAAEAGLQVIDVHAAFVAQPLWQSMLEADGVHPNANGLQFIVDAVLLPQLRSVL